jgi:hypothetical protein
MKKFGIGVVLGWLVFACLSAGAHASTGGSSTTSAGDVGEPSRLYLSVSMSEGTSSLSNPVPGSTGTSGNQMELMLLVSMELGSFVLEGGGGWLHDTLTGTASPTGTAFGPTSYSLVTDAAIAEFSPQIKVIGHFRVGPVAEALMGPDVSFVPGFGPGQSLTWMGGAQALYEFHLSGSAIRAGARYLSSLNIADHQLQSVQATLQFGLPVL